MRKLFSNDCNNVCLHSYNFCQSSDVFHKECLNDWASRMAPNTAPAGYKCPVCSSPVFPAPNLVSPVADRLREMISIYPWAQTGLGLPLVSKVFHIYLVIFLYLYLICSFILIVLCCPFSTISFFIFLLFVLSFVL